MIKQGSVTPPKEQAKLLSYEGTEMGDKPDEYIRKFSGKMTIVLKRI